MNMVDRLEILDRMIYMQLITMEYGKVRVTCSTDLIKRDNE